MRWHASLLSVRLVKQQLEGVQQPTLKEASYRTVKRTISARGRPSEK